MPTFSLEQLQRLAQQIFAGCGAPPAEANLVAEHLVESSVMGIDSHGVMRIPQYVDNVRRGVVKPGSPVSIVKDGEANLLLDCNFNFGQIGGTKAAELAIRRAGRYGVTSVAVKNCNHTGRIGAYVQSIAKAGMIGLAMSNGPKNGHSVAPFGGREARLATNPIAFAAPTSGEPILMDISTSITSEGKIRLHRDEGRQLPGGWILDGKGEPSCNPRDFYAAPRGTILPLGGSAGYKGFSLATMVEILAGTLSGQCITSQGDEHNGLWILAISVESILGLASFTESLGALIHYLKSSAPAANSSGARLPGEPEFETARVRREQGIEIHDATWSDICRISRELNVEV
jgi:uncharacterized oxidoreductase